MTGIHAVHRFDGQPTLVAVDIEITDARSSERLVVKQSGQTRTNPDKTLAQCEAQ